MISCNRRVRRSERKLAATIATEAALEALETIPMDPAEEILILMAVAETLEEAVWVVEVTPMAETLAEAVWVVEVTLMAETLVVAKTTSCVWCASSRL